MDSAADQEEDAAEVAKEVAMSRRTLTFLTATAAALLAVLGGGAPAGADHADRVIVLPGATSASPFGGVFEEGVRAAVVVACFVRFSKSTTTALSAASI